MKLPRFNKRSRVARRILASFVLAAALPLTILAGVSYHLVSQELQRHALEDTQRLVREIGMAVYDRLKFVNDELVILRDQGAFQSDTLPMLSGLDLKDRIHALFTVSPKGEVSGDLFLGERQQAELLKTTAAAEEDKSLLVMSGGSTTRRLFLMVPDTDRWGPAHWLGVELNTEFLWNTADAGERPERICILGPENRPVYCNHPKAMAWLAASADLLQSRARPRALEIADGERVFTAAWSLYLKPHYQLERWTVVAGVPESIALSSIQGFGRIFAAVAALALLLAYVLGSRMIEGNLRPLQTLRKATRELAGGRFAHRVSLQSNDEFQELGESFNGMATQIGRQFEELDTLGKLDHAMQAALSPQEAVNAGASALFSLLGPGRSAIFCLESWEGENALWYTNFTAAVVSQGDVGLTTGLGSGACSGTSAGLRKERAYLQLAGEPSGDQTLQLVPVVNRRHVKAEILLLDPLPDDEKVVAHVADVLATVLNKLVLDQRMRYQAGHDWLTGLLNRHRMNELFDEWARHALIRRAVIGMLELNIDRFKQVNDAHGHAQGDQLLIEVARRLQQLLPEGAVLSRFGSDEFVIMLRSEDHYQLMTQMMALGQRIGTELDRPLRVAHREFRLSASMGAAIFPRHGDCFAVMLQNTDAALRAAKAARRGSLLMFSSGMRDALVGRMDVEQALKGAQSNGEILMHYQPVVDASSGMTMSAEALMRWQRPGIGLVRPDQFIDVAEETGQIVELGAWALAEVCRQLSSWRETGLPIETVSVNVSGLQLVDPEFEGVVQRALQESGIDPWRLSLEVTETALVGRFEQCARQLARLRELGVKVTIDDFGTGYASFKYLKMLPIDGVKIDGLFIQDLPDSRRDAAIVAAVVSLATANGFKLVAEGVQNRGQARFLRTAGVKYLQGYLYGRDLCVESFERRLLEEQDSGMAGGALRA